MREYCSLITSWRNCSSVASAEMATMLGRGVITSRTTLSPNSTTDWISLRSSSSMRPSSVPAEISASMFSAGVGSSSGVPVSSVRSMSDWKKSSSATQRAGHQGQAAKQRAPAAAASVPEVRRYSNCGTAYEAPIMVSHAASAAFPERRAGARDAPSADQARHSTPSSTSSVCLMRKTCRAPSSVSSPSRSSSVSLKNLSEGRSRVRSRMLSR